MEVVAVQKKHHVMAVYETMVISSITIFFLEDWLIDI